MEHNRARPFFDQFSPKAAFLFGLVLSTAVLSLLGFVLVVTLFRDGGSATAKAKSSGSTSPTAAANTNAATQLSYRPVTKDDHIRGADNAEVTLIEYSDLECPFCKRVHPTMKQVLEEYDGKVRWVYRHYPLASLHPKAENEAVASECAHEQGKFWDYIDIIYDRTPSNNGLEEAKLTEFAQELKLDMKKFSSCLDGKKYLDRVQGDVSDAQQAGTQGTPHSLIIDKQGNVTPISGALPYADFKSAIDAALAS
ncbi:MAG: DsbA family protein [Candidatus Kerfeldbacteria bacterium]|nr:DsbA family protein [Candidatus Kerfeldbacteria bacterium]